MKIQRRRVVVTGAAGYVGRHVVTALLNHGYEVTAVLRNGGGSAEVDDRADIAVADVLDPSLAVEAVVPSETLALIHLAWRDGFVHNSRRHLDDLPHHVRFLQACVPRVQRLAALGTMHEVGYWEGAIDADTPTNPRTLYGVSKDALRRALEIVLPGSVEHTWLRCFYIYGDDRRNRSVFTRLLEAAESGASSMPFTTGVNKYDFIHVHELAEQIAVAATTPGVTGIVNCSSGVATALAAMAERFIAANELAITLDYGAYPDRAYDSPAVWGDAHRIKELMRARNAPGSAPVG